MGHKSVRVYSHSNFSMRPFISSNCCFVRVSSFTLIALRCFGTFCGAVVVVVVIRVVEVFAVEVSTAAEADTGNL